MEKSEAMKREIKTQPIKMSHGTSLRKGKSLQQIHIFWVNLRKYLRAFL
jgi:hypothetical protein